MTTGGMREPALVNIGDIVPFSPLINLRCYNFFGLLSLAKMLLLQILRI